ncbi:MAG: hydantoinase/oxoprolinase family protein [Solirubrobacterales bacterium]|nr:hydantoinase/oxoprolinase family protein [Solirubrobacterales bacterium]
MSDSEHIHIGIDIGGTFTDCAVIGGDGHITSAKAPTTKDDPSRGFFEALELVAAERGTRLEELLAGAEHIFHGTTVGTNALLERTGARTGVLTTRGIGDSLGIMRGYGRVAGLAVEHVMRASVTARPEPLVPRSLVREIDERVDAHGEVVVELDEDAVATHARELASTGVEALAICFLWSFVNPGHERRAAEIVREATGLYVSCSSDLVPKWGEYERLAATAINCYVGPVVDRYVGRLREGLERRGYQGRPLFLDCRGGVMTGERAVRAPLLTIDSGPAGGIVGAARLAAEDGAENVICTDMGGTSFDVGLIVDGQPVPASKTIVSQYEYHVPRLDIRSVGAGGGSYVRHDPLTNTLKVGPDSAGSDPGPVCYGRGGTQATITDADVVLGYVNPEYFLAGRIELDLEAAVQAFERVGAPLGLTAVEAAAGACRIIDHRMADLIRQMTVQRGRDPREFTVYCYGGAGPVHAGGYARELGSQRVVVPLGDASSVWSAFGAAHCDLRHVAELTSMAPAPFDERWFNAQVAQVHDAAVATLVAEGAAEEEVVVSHSADIRYRGQLYELAVAIPRHPCSAADIAGLAGAFEARYEQLYGVGAGFPEAGLEVVTFRAEGVAAIERHPLERAGSRATSVAPEAQAPPRRAHWHELGGERSTPVYWGDRLAPGNEVEGPAIIDLPETTVVVRPGTLARVDDHGSILMTV